MLGVPLTGTAAADWTTPATGDSGMAPTPVVVSASPALATHRVLAHAPALAGALDAVGWRQLVPLCASWLPPGGSAAATGTGAGQRWLWTHDPDQVWERANPLTEQVDNLLIWAEATAPPGANLASDTQAPLHWWRLAVVSRPLLPDPTAAVPLSYDASAVLDTELGWGLTERHGQVAPWLQLWRAPGEIAERVQTRDWAACAPPPGEEVGPDANDFPAARSACHGPALLPPPLPLEGPLADTLVWRSNRPTDCVALTFDACSTFTHGAYDPAVIEVLMREQVPATLFVGGHWAQMHADLLVQLGRNPQFELGNHPHMGMSTTIKQLGPSTDHA